MKTTSLIFCVSLLGLFTACADVQSDLDQTTSGVSELGLGKNPELATCNKKLVSPSIGKPRVTFWYNESQGNLYSLNFDSLYTESSFLECPPNEVFETIRYDLKRVHCSNKQLNGAWLSEIEGYAFIAQVTPILSTSSGSMTYESDVSPSVASFFGLENAGNYDCQFVARARSSFERYETNGSGLSLATLSESPWSEEYPVLKAVKYY